MAPGLRAGDILDETNAGLAADLLPPKILKHYKMGARENPIASWPEGIMRYEESFDMATRENAPRCDIDPDAGTIIEHATSKPPEYLHGIPFPDLSEDDPLAGIEAVWNQFHPYWQQGSSQREGGSEVKWI